MVSTPYFFFQRVQYEICEGDGSVLCAVAGDVRSQVGKPGAYTFETVDSALAERARSEIEAVYEQAYGAYERLVEAGVKQLSGSTRLIRSMRVRAAYNATGTDKNPYLLKEKKPSKTAVRIGILYLVSLIGALVGLFYVRDPLLLPYPGRHVGSDFIDLLEAARRQVPPQPGASGDSAAPT